ncbi:hypothetical protein C8J48_0925 [Desmospora activa DSM 45169]|uniref:Uncharacterized protein n=1 Tax=Desmospora activa DSM 45169 TaxID=1121389 RepID=A0A2T4Z8W8_9BACL|nr:hypothetical protein C8J48_0925 [Desmospora activa DSM 45169]
MPKLKPGEKIIVPRSKVQEIAPIVMQILLRIKQEEQQKEQEAINS